MKEFLFKYGLVIFLMITMSILAYQKEAAQIVPTQDVLVNVITPMGGMPVIIKKGLLSLENENKTWITVEDFKKKLEKRKSRVDNKNPFEVHK